MRQSSGAIRVAASALSAWGLASCTVAGVAPPTSTPTFVEARVAQHSSEYTDNGDILLFAAGEPTIEHDAESPNYRLASAQRSGTEALLFFRTRDAAYVTRDARIIGAAQNILSREFAIRAQRYQLGQHQLDVGRQQNDASRAQWPLSEQRSRAVASEQVAIDARLKALQASEKTLARLQQQLGRQAEVLEAEEKKARNAATPALRALAERAITSGVAVRLL